MLNPLASPRTCLCVKTLILSETEGATRLQSRDRVPVRRVVNLKVLIKSFDINMEVKSKGIEFEVRKADGTSQLGDCYLTKTGLTWCEGQTTKANGVKISWNDLRHVLASLDAKKAAVTAARSV